MIYFYEYLIVLLISTRLPPATAVLLFFCKNFLAPPTYLFYYIIFSIILSSSKIKTVLCLTIMKRYTYFKQRWEKSKSRGVHSSQKEKPVRRQTNRKLQSVPDDSTVRMLGPQVWVWQVTEGQTRNMSGSAHGRLGYSTYSDQTLFTYITMGWHKFKCRISSLAENQHIFQMWFQI